MTARRTRRFPQRRPLAISQAPASFEAYVDALILRYGTAQRLADALGITLSAFLRGVRAGGTLSVVHCLKLAEFVGDPPSMVLRLAGKSDAADLIERVYRLSDQPEGPGRDLIALWAALTPERREALRVLLAQSAPTMRRRA